MFSSALIVSPAFARWYVFTSLCSENMLFFVAQLLWAYMVYDVLGLCSVLVGCADVVVAEAV